MYVIFEQGETHRGLDRIVRVGTHTGDRQLRSRLKQHFVNENKNRSIFRKNIGRCFLHQANSPYAPLWELDTTSRADREKNAHRLDPAFEKELEKRISDYIRSNLSFCVFGVDDKSERLSWESKIVSTLARAGMMPSPSWLGRHSPKDKIKTSGLWQVNELYNVGLGEDELESLKRVLAGVALIGKG